MNEACKVPRNAYYDDNVTVSNESISTTHSLILLYKGEEGQKIIKSLNNYVKRLLRQNYTAQHAYISRKLGSVFDRKNQAKVLHKQDLTCPEIHVLKHTYSARRLNVRIKEHAGKDNKLHMLKHTFQSGHPSVFPNDFRIPEKGYNNHKVKKRYRKPY